MLSYAENETSDDKIFKHSKGNNFFLKVSPENDFKEFKLHIFVKIAKKTSFWAKNDVIRQKWDVARQKICKNIQHVKGKNFFSNSFVWKRL